MQHHKQYRNTQWRLCLKDGGPTFGSHWEFTWLGDRQNIEIETMPRHGEIVDGVPVLLPVGHGAIWRIGLECRERYKDTDWELVLAVMSQGIIFHWWPRWIGKGAPDMTNCPLHWSVHRTLPILRPGPLWKEIDDDDFCGVGAW